MTGTCVSSYAEIQSSREYKLKAGLIYNLAKFVVYPKSSFEKNSDRFTVGILGKDPFGNEMDILVDKTILDKKIKIIRYECIKDIKNCHMLFISRSEKANVKSILEKAEQKSILTISDMEEFAENGGMINFVTINNRIGFKVNLRRVRKAELKLSAHFLKLATVIDQ